MNYLAVPATSAPNEATEDRPCAVVIIALERTYPTLAKRGLAVLLKNSKSYCRKYLKIKIARAHSATV